MLNRWHCLPKAIPSLNVFTLFIFNKYLPQILDSSITEKRSIFEGPNCFSVIGKCSSIRELVRLGYGNEPFKDILEIII